MGAGAKRVGKAGVNHSLTTAIFCRTLQFCHYFLISVLTYYYYYYHHYSMSDKEGLLGYFPSFSVKTCCDPHQKRPDKGSQHILVQQSEKIYPNYPQSPAAG